MDNIMRKPYLAEILGRPEAERRYVYPREDLLREPIFPYLVLDGGAYLFISDHVGEVGSDALLERAMSGEIFDLLRGEDGEIDWLYSSRVSTDLGLPSNYEWQSWPQRLYMLLPIAQKYLQTGERRYADRWLEILRMWIVDAPYEPLDSGVSHVSTSMKWRDMQVSWRTMVLLHSIYMLGSHEGAFSREEWEEIYAFLVLNLDHLRAEVQMDMSNDHLLNHTLQKGVALVIAGITMPELPRAEEYLRYGKETVAACFGANILPDGGMKEVGPSYNHFISRMYLEAQRSCEINGDRGIEGVRDSIVKQYGLLSAISTRHGRSLQLSDSYGLDAHADILRAGELMGFSPDLEKKSILMPHNQYAMLRGERSELAIDAMPFFGGHQHRGRIQPLLWVDGQELLVDTGCFNYDLFDRYVWCQTADAHSVVTCDAYQQYLTEYEVAVTEFDAERNILVAYQRSRYEGMTYTWTRRVELLENGARFTDTIDSDREQTFRGRWYLPDRTTVLEDGEPIPGCIAQLMSCVGLGRTARQCAGRSAVAVRSTEPLTLARTPGIDSDTRPAQLAQLTWTRRGRAFTVVTDVVLE